MIATAVSLKGVVSEVTVVSVIVGVNNSELWLAVGALKEDASSVVILTLIEDEVNSTKLTSVVLLRAVG